MEEAAAIQNCLISERLLLACQPSDRNAVSTLLTKALLNQQERELAYAIRSLANAV